MIEHEIASLDGGEHILAARDRVRRLLGTSTRAGHADGGALGGWDGLARHGPLAALLPSELLADSVEFVRRRFDGEQLHLARRQSPTDHGVRIVWLDLTPDGLGLPLRVAVGAALALRETGTDADRDAFRVVVAGGQRFPLRSSRDLESLLRVMPGAAHSRDAVAAIRAAWTVASSRPWRLSFAARDGARRWGAANARAVRAAAQFAGEVFIDGEVVGVLVDEGAPGAAAERIRWSR